MEPLGELCGGCFREYEQPGACPFCGFDTEAERRRRGVALPLFTVLNGRYLMGRVLGAGGFGITYLAMDLHSGKTYAIKEYFPADIAVRCADGSVAPTRSEKVYERYKDGFYEEARLLQELQDSPYVVHVSAFFRCNNTAYLVMDYIDGPDLKKKADQQGGSMPYGQVCGVGLQLAKALRDVHEKGILHRDINPQNALIDGNGDVWLIDFGSSRMGFRDAGKSVSIRLTEGYAAPEQYYIGGKQGPWTDEYALACTFYRLATGVSLPSALDRQHKDEVLPLHRLLPEADRAVSDAIEKAMSLEPKKRYPSMTAFLRDFGPAAEEAARKAPVKQAFIEFMEGPAKGMLVELTEGQTLSLGRQRAKADLVVSHAPVVSRRHCELVFDPASATVLLTDCSENGTFLSDGTRIRQETCAVTKDVTVRLASSDGVFRIKFS